MRGPACLLLALGLAGCAGKPTTYLTLSPVPGPARVAAGAPLAVSRIDIPPAIDRSGFTTATGPATLSVAGDTKWAGPVGVMGQIALARDLADRLSGVQVLMPGDPLPAGGARQVQVNIQTFLADGSGAVTLDADWAITGSDGAAVQQQGRFDVTLQGGTKPAEEAATMSRALGELADRIAAAS